MLSLSLCPAESPNELSLPSLPTRLASNALYPGRAFWASTCIALAEGVPPLSLGSPLSCAWLPYTLLTPVMCRPGFLLIFIWKRGLLGKLSLRPLPQVTDGSPVYLPGSQLPHRPGLGCSPSSAGEGRGLGTRNPRFPATSSLQKQESPICS